MNTTFNNIPFLIIISFLFYCNTIHGQIIGGVKMKWESDWSEWALYENDSWEEEIGDLELRWIDRWDAWDYRLGEEFGAIRMKWKNNPNIWELKANNQIITFETIWRNDFDTWRIRTSEGIIQVSARDRDFLEEWETKLSKEEGDWAMWTEYENELNSWIILDELNDDFSLEVKMIMLFIPIITHFPK